MVKEIPVRTFSGYRGPTPVIALVDDEDFDRASSHDWYKTMVACAKIDGVVTLLSRFVLNIPHGTHGIRIMPRDGDWLNCQKSNLRVIDSMTGRPVRLAVPA